MSALKAYKSKANDIIKDILTTCDFSEKELIILAAAMQIVKYEPDDIIIDELDGVEMYLKKYQETNDPDYLTFAKDEMKHAKKPFAALRAKQRTATSEEADFFNKIAKRISQLETALATHL